MGIDFSHSDASWAYSGFNRFRTKLAKEIGINLDEMTGFKRDKHFNYVEGLSWKNVIDPIKPLLDHSDCGGILTPEECSQIAPRLRQLLIRWPDDDYDKQKGILLAEGMEQCAKLKENMEFI